MRAGPKSAPSGAPLPLAVLPAGGGERVVAFVEEFCRVPKGGAGNPAGAPLRLRGWQRDFLGRLYDPVPRPRQALLSVARKNGKSLLAAALALYHLLADGEESAEVLVASSDERTARVVFAMARRMVELDDRLSGVLQVFQDRLYHPGSDSVLEVLPAEARRLQGRNPSAAIVDEVHVTDPDTWDALALAGGTRARPLTLGISTECDDDPDNLLARLVDHGRFAGDSSFAFMEFSAPVGCELGDRLAWAAANPMLGDTLDPEHLATVLGTTRENAFRRYHLNQRVGAEDRWMAPAAWTACARPERIADGAEVVVGLDGSFSQDCTVIVAATISTVPHLDLVGAWVPPVGDFEYRVPVADVEAAIRAACRRWQVREIAADPFRWQRSLEALGAENLPVVEFPQSPARMTPATTGLYEAVVNNRVTHAADPLLTEHVLAASVKDDARGVRLAKPRGTRRRRIDAAVAAVMAHARAGHYARTPTRTRRVATFR